MGGKGGGGPVATNDQIVQMQMQQAQQAANANAQTQARLNYGVNEINQIFGGTPSGSTLLDLSSLANAQPYTGAAPTTTTAPHFATSQSAPSQAQTAQLQKQLADINNQITALQGQGAQTVQGQNTAGTQGQLQSLISDRTLLTNQLNAATRATTPSSSSYGGQLANGYTWGVLGDTGGGVSYGIFDPSGNLVTDANSLQQLSQSKIYTGGDPSQTTGGFPQSFYDNYRNSIMNYYLPQEDQQYNNARSSLNYSLARAGQLQSGVAGMDIANLANQNQVAQAQIGSQADTQEAALRTQIQQDQQTALNQLYSTENPTVAANTAQNMVANANLTKPVLDPVGQLFSNISVGVGNAISGFTNPYAYINPSAGGMGQLTTQGTGATASGSSSSGVSGSVG